MELVGQGGMSHVFLAEEDCRKVAIKVPNRRVQNDDTLMLRFLRESSVLLRLQHPNIVDVIEIATLGREPYIVMEYFAEGSLRTQLRRRGRFTTEEAVSILIQAVRGLAAALDKGVLHRDVKPHNLFMAADGILKVGDFGLAEIADEDSLTDPGQLLGTRAYLAPEVVANGAHSHLSDQYSLGVSTYELLTGSRPYIPEREVSNGRFRSALLDVGADPRLTDCVGKMTSADPLARFDSYATLENALTQLLPTEE